MKTIDRITKLLPPNYRAHLDHTTSSQGSILRIDTMTAWGDQVGADIHFNLETFLKLSDAEYKTTILDPVIKNIQLEIEKGFAPQSLISAEMP